MNHRFPPPAGIDAIWPNAIIPLAHFQSQKVQLRNSFTDSISSSAMEVTNPAHNEPRFRNLYHWTDPKYSPISDLAKGEVKIIANLNKLPNQPGVMVNDPIIPAVRAIHQSSKFGYTLDPNFFDWAKKAINKFEPEKISQASETIPESYTKAWLNKFAQKLLSDAKDPFYTSKILDDLGLKPKLLAWESNEKTRKSLERQFTVYPSSEKTHRNESPRDNMTGR